MTAILLPLLLKFWWVIGGALGILGWGISQRRSGARNERARQAASEKAARDISDEVQNDVGALTPEQAREALKKWSRR
jgi:hypothetical protein